MYAASTKVLYQKIYKKAFDTAMKKYGVDASVIVMPYGGSTLPRAQA